MPVFPRPISRHVHYRRAWKSSRSLIKGSVNCSTIAFLPIHWFVVFEKQDSQVIAVCLLFALSQDVKEIRRKLDAKTSCANYINRQKRQISIKIKNHHKRYSLAHLSKAKAMITKLQSSHHGIIITIISHDQIVVSSKLGSIYH